MKDYLQRRLDAGTVWMGNLPREIRLPLTFAASCAVYYLVYAVLLIFYLGQGSAEEYLRYEALLLGVIAVLSSLVGLAVAFRRGGESLVCARAALRQIRRPEIFLLWIWLVLAVLNSFLSSRFHGLRLLANRWQLMDVFLCSLLLCPLGFALARLRSPRLLWIGMDAAIGQTPAIIDAICRSAENSPLSGVRIQMLLDVYPYAFYADDHLTGKVMGES